MNTIDHFQSAITAIKFQDAIRDKCSMRRLLRESDLETVQRMFYERDRLVELLVENDGKIGIPFETSKERYERAWGRLKDLLIGIAPNKSA
jgi:hypothetical protein